VFDLKDFSYKNMDFEAVKLLVTILQTHYEEILKHALIINRLPTHSLTYLLTYSITYLFAY
jgi:hypothetical protein